MLSPPAGAVRLCGAALPVPLLKVGQAVPPPPAGLPPRLAADARVRLPAGQRVPAEAAPLRHAGRLAPPARGMRQVRPPLQRQRAGPGGPQVPDSLSYAANLNSGSGSRGDFRGGQVHLLPVFGILPRHGAQLPPGPVDPAGGGFRGG